MSKRFILFVISFFISLNILLAQDKDNCIDRNRQICINTIKKFPYSQLLEDLKRSNDFFILVLTYNSDWGMYPSYIFVDKPIQLLNNKANVIVLNKKISDKISKLINSYIDFEKPLFVKHGGNSLPANFHVIVVYKNGKRSEIILSQLTSKITDKYENNVYIDKPFIFLAMLADATDTFSMFENIYGFFPISLKNIKIKK